MIFPKNPKLLIGEKYNDWSVISYKGRDKKSNQLYEVQCKCGFLKISVTHLIKKSMCCKSCSMRNRYDFDSFVGKTIKNCLVLSRIEVERGQDSRFLVQCKCGNERIVLGYKLNVGKSTHCPHCRIKTHGMSYTDTFRIWTGILRRCLNSKFKNFKYYGGRGIKVCDRWLKFENFLSDMGHRPPDLQIDRINNDGNYEPGNCRWVTSKINNSNKNIVKKVRGAV